MPITWQADPKRASPNPQPAGEGKLRLRDFLQQGKPGETLTPTATGAYVWAGPLEQATAGDPLAWAETLRELKRQGVRGPPPDPVGHDLPCGTEPIYPITWSKT